MSCWRDIYAEDFAGEFPTLRYGAPDGKLVVDVLTRLGTAFRFEDLESEDLEVEGVALRVASPRTLVRMKRGTLRPIDHADAAALARKFDLEVEE